MSTSPDKPRLFALLVAIDRYAAPIPALKGCVHDLNQVAAYLESRSDDFRISLKKLINEQATRDAIVDQFEHHLSQASEDDVVVFYYSGHGTQEDADPVFWPAEDDRKLESLVCYDSVSKRDDGVHVSLLSDKELRFLIHRISRNNPHIVTIFDCCHSGGNTRNAYITDESDNVRERRFVNRERLSQAFPVRQWEDFIFSGEISYEDARLKPIAELMPEGSHIQLAACQNDQSAFEVNGEGIFTKNLLEVLNRCDSDVTYYDLQSRIQQYIRGQFDQTPKIYCSGGDEQVLFQGFLSQSPSGKPLYGNISWNSDRGWIMDLGSMHGISKRSSEITVQMPGESIEFAASVKEVTPSITVLSFDDSKKKNPDKTKSYRGFPSNYLSRPIGIYLDTTAPAVKESLGNRLSSEPNFRITQNEFEADYCVRQTDSNLEITRPGTPGIPVVRPVTVRSSGDYSAIVSWLHHIAQFEFIKNLDNPTSFLFAGDPVDLRVLKTIPGKGEEPVPIRGGDIHLDYEELETSEQSGGIRIALSNRSDRKLYCALLYLSFNFGVQTKLLKQVVSGLEPGRDVWAADGAVIGLSIEDELKVYNYRESVTYLKLLVSTSDFKQQATRFEMPPLPKPGGTEPTGTRGLDTDAFTPGNLEDWTTRLVTIRIANPYYSPDQE